MQTARLYWRPCRPWALGLRSQAIPQYIPGLFSPYATEIKIFFMTVRDIIRRARAYRKKAGWTRARFAKEAGFKTDTTLQRLDERGYNPTAKTLERLEKFLGGWQPGDPINQDAA